MSNQLRKYFLFTYQDKYQMMLSNKFIGLEVIEEDLTVVYNGQDPHHALMQILKANLEYVREETDLFDTFLFKMNIGDIVCLTDNKRIYAIGVIQSNYRYRPNKILPHTRSVKWMHFDSFEFVDGNPRLRIRQIEKQTSRAIVEEIINDVLLSSDENTLLINYPSKITFDEYNDFFINNTLNPIEVRLLSHIFIRQNNGISVYELQKQFDRVRIDEEIEQLAKKIAKTFYLEEIDGRWTPNIFNGLMRDGHVCFFFKEELYRALQNSDIIHIEDNKMEYSINDALNNSVYLRSNFEEALRILEDNNSIQLMGGIGTGKSYFAQKLIYLLNESKSLKNVLRIKLHDNLTYEQLFSNKETNILFKFINKAQDNYSNRYVILLEGCNHPNLPGILGDFLYLLADNNRGKERALDVTYTSNRFYIPRNIYVVMTYRDHEFEYNHNITPNVMIYEMNPMFNQRFINLFEDNKLGRFISENITKVNEEYLNDVMPIAHGYFLMDNRGCNVLEYNDILNYKLYPRLKRLLDDNQVFIEIVEILTYRT